MKLGTPGQVSESVAALRSKADTAQRRNDKAVEQGEPLVALNTLVRRNTLQAQALAVEAMSSIVGTTDLPADRGIGKVIQAGAVAIFTPFEVVGTVAVATANNLKKRFNLAE